MYNVIYIRFYFSIAFLFDVFANVRATFLFYPLIIMIINLNFVFFECWELDTLDLSKVTMT